MAAPHAGLRLGVKRVEAAGEGVGAVAVEELAEPAGGDVVGRELARAVALALLAAADVREDEVDGRRSGPSAEDLDRRDAQPLLIASVAHGT